jgi:hypothetical protein
MEENVLSKLRDNMTSETEVITTARWFIESVDSAMSDDNLRDAIDSLSAWLDS